MPSQVSLDVPQRVKYPLRGCFSIDFYKNCCSSSNSRSNSSNASEYGVSDFEYESDNEETPPVEISQLLIGMHASPEHPMFDRHSDQFVCTPTTCPKRGGADGDGDGDGDSGVDGVYDPRKDKRPWSAKTHMGNVAHQYMRRLNAMVDGNRQSVMALPEAREKDMLENGFGKSPFLEAPPRHFDIAPPSQRPQGRLREFCGTLVAQMHKEWRKTSVVRLLSLISNLEKEYCKLQVCALPRECTATSLQGLYDSVFDRDAEARRRQHLPDDPPGCRVFHDAIDKPMRMLEQFVLLQRCLAETPLVGNDPVHPFVLHVWELVLQAFMRTCERVGYEKWQNTCYSLVSYEFVVLALHHLGTRALSARMFKYIVPGTPRYVDISTVTTSFPNENAPKRVKNDVSYYEGAVVSVINPPAVEAFREMRLRACDLNEKESSYMPTWNPEGCGTRTHARTHNERLQPELCIP